MSKIIIVEGIDRIGKSTLCKLLSKKYDIPIFKENPYYGWYQRQRIVEKMFTIMNMVEQLNLSIIIDRFYLTEFVYGYLNRKEEIDKLLFDRIESKLNLLNTALILVNPENVKVSSLQHGSDLSQHEKLFTDLFWDSSINKKVTTVYKDFEKTSEELKEWIFKFN